eukprot:gene5750-6453_t
MASYKKMQALNVIDIEKRRVPSKHYVFVLEITWDDGSQNIVYRRYSQFFQLQTSLIDAFPVEGGVKNPADRILPFLPGKVLFRSHVREVALKRKAALEDYCKKLVKLPAHILNSDHVTLFFEATCDDICTLTNSLKDENRKKKSQRKADVISEPVLLEQYLALGDFKKSGRGQISMVAGDIVDVIEKTDNGWFFVSLDDEQGWVPCSYLESIQGTDSAVTVEKCLAEEKFVCIKPYKAVLDDEIDLELGSIVSVFEKGLDGWWHVRYRGKEGWAPRAYLKDAAHLKISSTSSDVINDNGAIQQTGKIGLAPPPRRRTVRRTISADVKRASIKRSKNNPDDRQYVAVFDYQMKIGVENVCIAQGKSFELIEKAPNGWSLIKIGNEEGWVPSNVLTKQREGTTAIFEDTEDIYANVKNIKIEDVDVWNEIDVEENNNDLNERYVTIGAFATSDESGISFSEATEVEVLEKRTSGWWFIKIGNNEGWAPSTYLTPSAPKKLVSSNSGKSDEKLEIALNPPKPNRKSALLQSYENVKGDGGNKQPQSRAKPKTPSPVDDLHVTSPKPIPAARPILPAGKAQMPQPRCPPPHAKQMAELKKAFNKATGPSKPPQPRPGLEKIRGIVSVDEFQLRAEQKTPPPKPSAPVRKISEPTRRLAVAPRKISNGQRNLTEQNGKTQARLSPAIPERPKLESLNLYVTKSAYDDNDDGMLSFGIGEKVEVLDKDDGGWWFARIGVKKGWVPSNFLQKL